MGNSIPHTAYYPHTACFGQGFRRLVRAGIPSKHLYGFDLEQRFTDFGYEPFQNPDTFKATFLSGDVFAPHHQVPGKVAS